MVGRRSVSELIAANDLDELIREIDRLCEESAWDALMDLRERCARSHESGRQMWPAASHAEHRLALEAPGPWAGAVVTEGAAHLGLGPLSEVAASTHTWAELWPYLPEGPLVGVVAAERVVRGEMLVDDPRLVTHEIEIPLAVQSWEPTYAVATYHSWKIEAPAPTIAAAAAVTIPGTGFVGIGPGPETAALADVARSWVTTSTGTSRAVGVSGGALDAIAALGATGATAAPVVASDALALIAWAAASGGAVGRRRGAAAGRATAWWTAAVLCGLDDDWPPEPAELGNAIAELEWWVWSPAGPSVGWACRIAVADPVDGLAWALDAVDHA